jgi:hypothetical protein
MQSVKQQHRHGAQYHSICKVGKSGNFGFTCEKEEWGPKRRGRKWRGRKRRGRKRRKYMMGEGKSGLAMACRSRKRNVMRCSWERVKEITVDVSPVARSMALTAKEEATRMSRQVKRAK